MRERKRWDQCVWRNQGAGVRFFYTSPRYRNTSGASAPGMRSPCAILHLQICTYCISVSGGGFVRVKKEIGTHFGATKARESSSSCKVSTRDDKAVVLTPAPSRLALGAVFDESTAHQHTEKEKAGLLSCFLCWWAIRGLNRTIKLLYKLEFDELYLLL